MATVLVSDLSPRLRRELGDTDSSNYYYDNDDIADALYDGLEDYNQDDMAQEYAILGSGESAYYSPTPPDVDKRLLILCSARAKSRGDLNKFSREAVDHLNPSGRTNLGGRAKEMRATIKYYDDFIEKIKGQRDQRLVNDEMYDDDASMELRNKDSEDSLIGVEGLPETIIIQTV